MSFGLIALLLVGVESGEADFLLGTAGSADFAAMEARQQLGANAFREDVNWSRVESEPGKLVLPEGYSRMVADGGHFHLEPLAILLYGNRLYGGEIFPVTPVNREAFVRYAAFVVDALPAVRLWEVWNEWNFGIGTPSHEPGMPEDYVKLLAETYAEIKRNAPGKFVIGGSMAGIGRKDAWTKRALDAGMLEHLDGLSFHPYVYWMRRKNRVPERGMVGLVSELENLLAHYPKGREVPLYVTEIGWPTHEGRDGVTLEQQADYLSRALLLLRADSRIRGVWVHTLMDRAGSAGDREAHFGLLFPDGSPKPAWFSFRDTAGLLEDVAKCRRIDFGSHSDAVAGVELIDRTGGHYLAIWTIDDAGPWQVELACQSAPASNALKRSILGNGRGPDVSLETDEALGRTARITVTSSPTVLYPVGAYWKILNVVPVSGEHQAPLGR